MPDPVAGVRAFYDAHSETFLEHAGPTFQAGLVRSPDGVESPEASDRALARTAGVRPGDRVLDAGCGVAGPAIHIARGFEGVQVDGVTVSPVQVALGRERVLAAGLADRVRVHEADYHHLPFDDGTFDQVLFLESAGYSTRLPALFAEASRVLRPGGRLFVKDVFTRAGPLTAAQREELRSYDATWAMPSTPRVADVEQALAGAGFEGVESQALDTGGDWFLGSMFELGEEGFRLNAFGEGFFRRFEDLPILFAQVQARKPG